MRTLHDTLWTLCLVLFPIIAMGCGPSLEDGFEDALTNTGGCGDVQFYAVDEADEVMLSFYVSGLLEAAHDAGEEKTTEFDFPSNEANLVVDIGERLSDAMCDDVIENGGGHTLQTYRAVSGTARVTAWPGEEGDYTTATGDLILENVEFKTMHGGGKKVTLESLDIMDAQVGWFAG